jgi:uncharacterized protein (TIGR03067 family)
VNTITILGLAVAVAAPLPKERPEATQSVVGEWVLVKVTCEGRVTYDGAERAADPDHSDRYVFSDDGTYSYFTGSQRRFRGAKFVANPKASPRTLDLDLPVAPEGKVIRGIYQVDGDVMIFCWNFSDQTRPTMFESTPGSSDRLYVFKRAKKE